MCVCVCVCMCARNRRGPPVCMYVCVQKIAADLEKKLTVAVGEGMRSRTSRWCMYACMYVCRRPAQHVNEAIFAAMCIFLQLYTHIHTYRHAYIYIYIYITQTHTYLGPSCVHCGRQASGSVVKEVIFIIAHHA